MLPKPKPARAVAEGVIATAIAARAAANLPNTTVARKLADSTFT